MALPRLLIIDHHDSYTLNLLSLLPVPISSQVVVLPHTHPFLQLDKFHKLVRPHIDAIILSPGPGTPCNPSDFGTAHSILTDESLRLPLLGVCLGHQGLATAFGGKVVRARSVRHGLKSRLCLNKQEGLGILTGLPDGAEVIRYNSLTVDEDALPFCLRVTAWAYDEPCSAPPPRSISAPSHSRRLGNTSLDSSRPSSPQTCESGSWGEWQEDLETRHLQRVVLALEHRTLPFYGVQFHPESIESSYGGKIMQNFLQIVARFSQGKGERGPLPEELFEASRRCVSLGKLAPAEREKHFQVIERRMNLPQFDGAKAAPEVFRRLFQRKSTVGAVWLDSARPQDPHSRFSYMAIPSFSLSYRASSRRLHLDAIGDDSNTNPIDITTTFWDFMDQLQGELKHLTTYRDDHLNLFRTGFVGYWGYEMKGESLGLDSEVPTDDKDRPDAEFMFCEKVLALDHHLNQWRVLVLTAPEEEKGNCGALGLVCQALKRSRQGGRIGVLPTEAERWLRQVSEVLSQMPDLVEGFETSSSQEIRDALPPLLPRHSWLEYMDRIESAREEIASGQSYELCMTTQFQGTLPPLALMDDLDHFGLYLKLRARNPAPYAAFLRLASSSPPSQRGRSLVCTSPERFMQLTASSCVEMKPIKGTLSRAGYGPNEEHMLQGTSEECTHWRTSEDARRRSRLAADVKERAENLMIVDLIRADLFSFCEKESVKVPTLMEVESYETVHQLVTTVQGKMKEGVGSVEAVRRCFPPGSMTGAPKRRSVELLEGLEGQRRGIYSGALGWMGIDGATDLAVIIRTLIADGDDVSIGAGGAITYLSHPEKEWQEVMDKVTSLAYIPS